MTERRCGLVTDDAEDMGPAAVVVHRAAHRLAVDRERGVGGVQIQGQLHVRLGKSGVDKLALTPNPRVIDIGFTP